MWALILLKKKDIIVIANLITINIIISLENLSMIFNKR